MQSCQLTGCLLPDHRKLGCQRRRGNTRGWSPPHGPPGGCEAVGGAAVFGDWPLPPGPPACWEGTGATVAGLWLLPAGGPAGAGPAGAAAVASWLLPPGPPGGGEPVGATVGGR